MRCQHLDKDEARLMRKQETNRRAMETYRRKQADLLASLQQVNIKNYFHIRFNRYTVYVLWLGLPKLKQAFQNYCFINYVILF